MGIGKGKTDYLLSLIREGKQMTLGQQLRLTAYLSVPAIMAQISSIAMQYIDASMVGSLGANAAASIGLVSTTTWLFWGVCAAAATGFSVQVAHRIGAGDFVEAKKILRQAVTATLVFSSLLAVGGICISGMLPLWLGGDEAIWNDSSLYFRIFALFLPALQLNFLAGGMLRCSGNMRVPAMLNNDVLAGCRVQLLPDLSDEACGVVRSSIYRSRCRSGCERCYIGNGIGRTRYRRRNDVVSMPPLAHAEVRRRTGKFSTQTGDIA